MAAAPALAEDAFGVQTFFQKAEAIASHCFDSHSPESTSHEKVSMSKGTRIEMELSVSETVPSQRTCGVCTGQAPHTIVAVLVALNTIQMGLETDFPHWTTTWTVCDNFFTIVFFFEAVIKIWDKRMDYFRDRWNAIDAALVIISMFDTWFLPLFQETFAGLNLRALSVFRILRLLRIVRALRLVRKAQGLVLVIIGVLEAMKNMLWICLGVLLAVYVGAIFLVNIFSGNMELYPGYSENPDEIEEMELFQEFNPHIKFGSMTRAMLTLFNIAILAEWNEILGPVMEKQPVLLVFFLVFVFTISLSTMNVIIGMIANSILENAERMKKDQLQRQIKTKMSVLHQIRDRVTDLDINGDGKISVRELESRMSTSKGFGDLFEVLESESLHLPRGFSGSELICMLDHDGDGVLEIDEFVGSFYRLIDSGDFQQTCIIQTAINSIKRMLTEHIRDHHEQQRRVEALLTDLVARAKASGGLTSAELRQDAGDVSEQDAEKIVAVSPAQGVGRLGQRQLEPALPSGALYPKSSLRQFEAEMASILSRVLTENLEALGSSSFAVDAPSCAGVARCEAEAQDRRHSGDCQSGDGLVRLFEESDRGGSTAVTPCTSTRAPRLVAGPPCPMLPSKPSTISLRL